MILIDQHSAFPGWWALLPVGGAVCLIAAGASNPLNRYLLANRFMVGVGLISFALYLWHWPLLSLLRIVKGEQAAGWMLAAAIGLAFCLAWLSYRLIETPIRARRGWLPITALVTLCVLLMGGSANIYTRDGLNFRLKDAQAKLESRALEWPDSLTGGEECAGFVPDSIELDCLIDDRTQPPTALIIGDSHANHYYWGLAEQLAPLGMNLMQLAEGGCMPLYGIAINDRGVLDTCRESMDRALDYALETPGIDTIFLSGRWTNYISGRELKDGLDHVPNETLLLPNDPESEGLDRHAVFSKAMLDTFERIVQSDKTIIFMHAVPELPFNARECVSWAPNRFINRVPRENCDVAYSVIYERKGEYMPLLDGILEQYPQISVFDPMPLLCDSERCAGRAEGLLLYRDDDHLSLEGSLWLGRQASYEWASLLGKTPDASALISPR